MSFPDERDFFESELAPPLEPLARKCEAMGYAFIVGVKGPTMPGTFIRIWDSKGIISFQQRQSIFSRLADLPSVPQSPVQECEV